WLKHVVRSVAPISDDIAKRGVTEGAYPRTPVAAVAQLHSLFAQTRRRLALVDAPVQLFRSTADNVEELHRSVHQCQAAQLFRSTVDNVVSERSVHELVEGLN